MSQDPQTEVPLRDSRGKIVRMITVFDAVQFEGHWRVKRNRRGNIQHAMERERVSTVPLSNSGTAFEQELPTGRVWSLRGTTGSEQQKLCAA